jgi:DNA segregation ATPase FtsK/SpoIIIE-like protein
VGELSNGQNRAVAVVMGILLLGAGFFLLVVLLDFDAAESPHFSDRVDEVAPHFLGWTGIRLSATLALLLGRGCYFLSLMIMYIGYILLRRVTTMKKVGYILLAGASILLFIALFSTIMTEPLNRGGGLFGQFVTRALPVSREMKLAICAVLLLGVLFLLFRVPLLSIFLLVRGSAPRTSRQSRALESAQKQSNRHHRPGKSMGAERMNQPGSSRGRKRLPLFSKVYIIDDEGYTPRKPVMADSPKRQMRKKERVKPDQMPGAGEIRNSPRLGPVGASSYLRKSAPVNRREQERETERKAAELERTLKEFGIDAKVTGIIRGPVITRYELQPAPGVKLSRIENLSNNIALNLSANGVRIEAPIPGRAAVGIEVPNEIREMVTLGDIIDEADKRGELPLVLGKEISGNVVVSDLTSMPHLLIAGATGSGKSVCVNSLIMSIISQKGPEDVRLLLIDPKMVELKVYNGIPHLLTEVVSDPRDAAKALRWVLYEMENRYRLLDENYVRNISGYNRKISEKMPYIIIIVDEFANLMAISQKEVEETVVRLAAMSRAVGIHLIMATQRPSVDVITGLIKANFPFRIAFQVASKTDSRTILDTIGAEKLLGSGDMLFAPAGSMNLQRIQGAFISEEEVQRVVQDLKKRTEPDYVEDIFSFDQGEGPGVDFDDPLLEQAVQIVVGTKRASASFLQRRLKIGYNRAARLIELMEEKGIIGPPRGSKPREIYVENLD